MNQKLEEVLMEKKLALSLTIAKILSSFLVAVTGSENTGKQYRSR